MIRTIKFLALFALLAAAALQTHWIASAFEGGNVVAVIVELEGEPAAV